MQYALLPSSTALRTLGVALCLLSRRSTDLTLGVHHLTNATVSVASMDLKVEELANDGNEIRAFFLGSRRPKAFVPASGDRSSQKMGMRSSAAGQPEVQSSWPLLLLTV